MASVEVLPGRERRGRWSSEQKQSIVAAAFEPGAVVRDVARQADVTPSLIYRWRRDLQAAANSFAQVLVAPAGDGAAILPVAVIEIEFRGNAQVRSGLARSRSASAPIRCCRPGFASPRGGCSERAERFPRGTAHPDYRAI